ncbi:MULTISPECIES: NAD(P)-dependent alcohol dehydrogenase [Priestia]|jgi:NADPH:quinone reductase-like Zn-dependent oxidoreductase|uniref:Oxidoreductase, zinc-binding dehydrogenase family n=2 Tax=Priestia TaxID=2800373 RepID=D5DYN2_PRIM1|nr:MULTISPECIES: NAD(P)-dependent alcohol dehydrogenase [Priestia]KQU16629.1 NADPH:quinone reductase [Bacillus sp. Leaf75]MBZ5481566.1 NAD(P)-dependent alcohol dehydrogenase [Bacillus sp. T_4]MDH6653672.1 NADPH:quinone reductase-like Zn-dependent oxidoreductase [Bacillus sp. PvP124]ADE70350.1 oxidoreductase, zinc-binding dehydrogenase family [Priestia megaterium QM B1551]KAA8748901.1 NAD(P)-dependent alcohol dehydrogenase [Priestia megaterium]
MKAMVCTKYGKPDVLQLQEVEKPIPKENEILIKIYATTVTSGDCRVRSFNSPLLLWLPMRIVLGLRKPRKSILGVELAGEVEDVGKNVTRFKKGDQLFAMTGMKFGGYAEYICLPEKGTIAVKPENVTYEEAASISFGGTTALHFFRKGTIQTGQKVLIYGASGAVGTAAVQLASYYGAEVTGVCSAKNSELVKSLGADRVIDYQNENFTEKQEKYDLIFDAVGKITKNQCKAALALNGRFVSVEGQGIAKVQTKDLLLLKKLIEEGQIKSVIDRCYSLEQVPEAHEYVETGHKIGSVVVTLKK